MPVRLRILVNGSLSQELQGYQHPQGDTLSLSAKIPVTGFSSTPTPVAKFVAVDNVNPAIATIAIDEDFDVSVNGTLNTLDMNLVMGPSVTESLVLDSTLGQVLGLSQSDMRYYQPAKRFYWEVQVTGLSLNRTYQGDFIIYTDMIKVNTSGTLPGI